MTAMPTVIACLPRACCVVLLLLACVRATAQETTPLEVVRDTSARMLLALQSERPRIAQDPERLDELVAEIVLPYFDFRRMSQWVLGRNWRTATPQQRERFVEQFRILLVRTYGRALSEYADEKVSYLPFDADSAADRVTVRTEIEQPGSTPIPIFYSMYLSDKGWKVYDVAISGVSLVTNYRSSFGSIIRKDGMDSLIEQLGNRNGGETSG
jgi:phospholipid transport system substrate-binding protein